MSTYRLRAEGALLVLQVQAFRDSSQYAYDLEPQWRDAKLEDIPIQDLFQSEPQRVVIDSRRPPFGVANNGTNWDVP